MFGWFNKKDKIASRARIGKGKAISTDRRCQRIVRVQTSLKRDDLPRAKRKLLQAELDTHVAELQANRDALEAVLGK
jgi:DNA-binding FrmR family transcriptional regulator